MARNGVPTRKKEEIEITEAIEKRIVDRLKHEGTMQQIAGLIGCQVKQVRAINEKYGIRKVGRRNA